MKPKKVAAKPTWILLDPYGRVWGLWRAELGFQFRNGWRRVRYIPSDSSADGSRRTRKALADLTETLDNLIACGVSSCCARNARRALAVGRRALGKGR